MQPWDAAQDAELRRLWDVHGGKFKTIGRAMGRSGGSISGRSRVIGLQFRGGRASILEPGNPALAEARTIYQHRVIAPDQNVLKTGDNQRKLGRVVTKGKWKGFPIYSLTLQERATCRTDCAMWRGCYGNNMGHAKRYQHGPELELQIWRELSILQTRHPTGFVIRLHLLGDFYSVSYVDLWRAALDHFPAMRVFGYTAWKSDSYIGRAVAYVRNRHWDRFAIRTSGAWTGRAPRAVTFVVKPPPNAIVCPAQQGRTANCASCALCWATKKTIAFKAH